MITVRQGGKVYGPGVFMFECEAAEVKAALLAYGTKAAKRMADEIGVPSDGVSYPHGGETSRETSRETCWTKCGTWATIRVSAAITRRNLPCEFQTRFCANGH